MPTIYFILTNLQEIFSGKGKSTRQVGLKTIMYAKMSEGTPFRDHMICMIKLFNKVEILGDKINGETQVDTVLKTLLDSFK